jgi:hypothetical protein
VGNFKKKKKEISFEQEKQKQKQKKNNCSKLKNKPEESFPFIVFKMDR